MADTTEADPPSAEILYPALPPPPSRTYSRTSKYTADDPLAPLRMTRCTPTKSPTPANIGRPRTSSSRIAALTHSPARPSHATQMSHHFTRSHAPSTDAPKLQLRRNPHDASRGDSDRSTSTSIGSDEDPLADLGMLADSPPELLKSPCENSQSASPMQSSPNPGTHRVRPLDGAIATHKKRRIVSPPPPTSSSPRATLAPTSADRAFSPPGKGDTASSGSVWFCPDPPPSPTHLPSPTRSPVCEEASSSESWTGDDDFMPRSARRRIRQRRLEQRWFQVAGETATIGKPGTISAFDGPMSPAFQERLRALNARTPSRFRNRLYNLHADQMEAVARAEKGHEVCGVESPFGCDADHEGEGGDVRVR
ncbi:hypothetical protein Tdes44962_MAKER07786 [Teratosphaeria destructans]|uniref:Uncharacterized protein n=1 Tax=Teratosphaeria destructans TaxID=418781 RepID=A0A9W7SXZ4_9PEZI|nr:hypothetical protein Tdes44962_MAKER07786 [Teratosphaeria destructans]